MEGKENKANGINMVLVVIIVILLGIVGYCAYRLGDTGRSVIDDENLQKGGNTSVTVETEETEDKKEVSKDTKEDTVVPTELDEDTKQLVELVAGFQFDQKSFTNEDILFYVSMLAVKNNNRIGYDHGDLFEVSKSLFERQLRFFSKEKDIDEIVNIESNFNGFTTDNYKITKKENGYIITVPVHDHVVETVKLINKETQANQLILNYQIINNDNKVIGESEVVLDYANSEFKLKSFKYHQV